MILEKMDNSLMDLYILAETKEINRFLLLCFLLFIYDGFNQISEQKCDKKCEKNIYVLFGDVKNLSLRMV